MHGRQETAAFISSNIFTNLCDICCGATSLCISFESLDNLSYVAGNDGPRGSVTLKWDVTVDLDVCVFYAYLNGCTYVSQSF